MQKLFCFCQRQKIKSNSVGHHYSLKASIILLIMICKMVNLVVRQELLDDLRRNAQREQNKSRYTSRADTKELWRSKKVTLLAKT